MKKAKDEQTARSKKEHTYKGNSIIFRAYLPNETQWARREWWAIVKMLNELNASPVILYPTR